MGGQLCLPGGILIKLGWPYCLDQWAPAFGAMQG